VQKSCRCLTDISNVRWLVRVSQVLGGALAERRAFRAPFGQHSAERALELWTDRELGARDQPRGQQRRSASSWRSQASTNDAVFLVNPIARSASIVDRLVAIRIARRP
jgi:hypothetical protein